VSETEGVLLAVQHWNNRPQSLGLQQKGDSRLRVVLSWEGSEVKRGDRWRRRPVAFDGLTQGELSNSTNGDEGRRENPNAKIFDLKRPIRTRNQQNEKRLDPLIGKLEGEARGSRAGLRQLVDTRSVIEGDGYEGVNDRKMIKNNHMGMTHPSLALMILFMTEKENCHKGQGR